ncbi:MAG: prepilin-type N-terminal cleavage/methylation domain-containing protein [Planctomycetota bacterium]
MNSFTLSRHRGMTLVEMLVATVITLIMMGLVAQLFGIMGEGISASRSIIEMTDQLRTISHKLRQDLAGISVDPASANQSDSPSGYLEIIEGPASDSNATPVRLTADPTFLTADCDDVVMFTARSLQEPFKGIFNSTTSMESPTAEISWFCKRSVQQPANGPTLYTLYRRQLLVAAYVGAGVFSANSNSISGTLPGMQQVYDVSMHADGSGNLYPNSLIDLAKRENRFLHNSTGTGVSVAPLNFPFPPVVSFPFIDPLTPPPNPAPATYGQTLTGVREGEDVVLTNVIAFDVRVFDPEAPIRSSGFAVTPDDPNFSSGALTNATGAYVDLNWGKSTSPLTIGSLFPAVGTTAFQGLGISIQNGGTFTIGPSTHAIYDTWSRHYEFNGVDDDSNTIVDQGTDGFDNNSNNLVDDALERETSPPYPVPLRGIEIRIRCYEPSSRQVRQVTVRHTFVPH